MSRLPLLEGHNPWQHVISDETAWKSHHVLLKRSTCQTRPCQGCFPMVSFTMRVLPHMSALTVDEEGGVATIVHEQVRARAIGPRQHLLRAPPVLLQRLALPGEDSCAVAGHRRCGVVLHRTTPFDQGWQQ